jgi:hypothetical protein
MREIRQSGSEGGAVRSRPYPYRTGFHRKAGIEVLGCFPGPGFRRGDGSDELIAHALTFT